MDQPNLPRYIVERVERRWAAVLSNQATLRPERDRVATNDPSPNLAKPAPDKETVQPLSAASLDRCCELVCNSEPQERTLRALH
jgi:hypothetical protein